MIFNPESDTLIGLARDMLPAAVVSEFFSPSLEVNDHQLHIAQPGYIAKQGGTTQCGVLYHTEGADVWLGIIIWPEKASTEQYPDPFYRNWPLPGVTPPQVLHEKTSSEGELLLLRTSMGYMAQVKTHRLQCNLSILPRHGNMSVNTDRVWDWANRVFDRITRGVTERRG